MELFVKTQPSESPAALGTAGRDRSAPVPARHGGSGCPAARSGRPRWERSPRPGRKLRARPRQRAVLLGWAALRRAGRPSICRHGSRRIPAPGDSLGTLHCPQTQFRCSGR